MTLSVAIHRSNFKVRNQAVSVNIKVPNGQAWPRVNLKLHALVQNLSDFGMGPCWGNQQPQTPSTSSQRTTVYSISKTHPLNTPKRINSNIPKHTESPRLLLQNHPEPPFPTSLGLAQRPGRGHQLPCSPGLRGDSGPRDAPSAAPEVASSDKRWQGGTGLGEFGPVWGGQIS